MYASKSDFGFESGFRPFWVGFRSEFMYRRRWIWVAANQGLLFMSRRRWIWILVDLSLLKGWIRIQGA